MKKHFLGMVVFLTGCGMSFDSTHIEDGRTIARTHGSVGFTSAESTTEHSDPRMETCLADLGNLPTVQDKDGNEVDLAATWCLQNAKRGLDRDNRQLDNETNARAYRGYYYP